MIFHHTLGQVIHYVHRSFIPDRQKLETTKEWNQKMWYIYIIGYYSAVKIKTSQISHANRAQTQNVMHDMLSLISGYWSKCSEYS